MRFKTILLIVALALFMLAGLAWSEDDEDDNPLPNLDPNCPFLVIIQAPSSTYETIADYFQEGGCEMVYNEEVKVETCTSDGDCDKNEKETTLGIIASSFAAIIPSESLVCALCEDATIEDAEIILTQVAEATQNNLSTGKRVNTALDDPVNFFTDIVYFELGMEKSLMP
jgi:hypothetical protein